VKSVLLVGKNSLIGSALIRSNSGQHAIEAVSHDANWDLLDWDRFDIVVNMACNPRYMREPYQQAFDFDRSLAERVRLTKCHYIMLSTRRVYGRSAPIPASELTITSPDDNYGRNKLTTEQAVQSILGDRCTILRVSNVFDFEPGRHTFFGIALGTLKQENKIVLDVSPFVSRDFVHVEDFAGMLLRIIDHAPVGILNVGSGRATEIGRIALWLLEGFGGGQLVVVDPTERDQFELDISRFEALFGRLIPVKDIRARCIDIGRRLRNE
jgi:UDP-glucose 4-epimerase